MLFLILVASLDGGVSGLLVRIRDVLSFPPSAPSLKVQTQE